MKPVDPEIGALADEISTDPALDRALAQLSRVEPPPWAAAAQLRVARTRFQGRGPVTRLERAEPAFLIGFGAIHLVWVLWRVLAISLG